MKCEFCDNEAEFKVFLAVKREMAPSRRSFKLTMPDGRTTFVARGLVNMQKLGNAFVVRVPIYFKERGTPVCESCSLKDGLLGFGAPAQRDRTS